MTTFTAYAFPTPATAPRLARRLEPLRERGMAVRDAAVVQWESDQQQPWAWQTETINDREALSGAFWGLLFAHLFLLPLSHSQTRPQRLEGDHTLVHLGIGQAQLHKIRQLVTPGSSALFVMTGGHLADNQAAGDETDAASRVAATVDKFVSRLGEADYRSTAIVLSAAQTGRLYAGFARHPAASNESAATGSAGP